ncbi:MAG: phosphoribosylanthranilate isomerase [Nitrospinae bacterium]|nr:phosphoribosylanthranilate isomerase [Nitrospinota bacterium]
MPEAKPVGTRNHAPDAKNPRALPPKIKLCGQTRLEDVRFSLENGADYCGVVINVPSSPRTMTVAEALPLFKEFGGKLFALTANADARAYSEIAEKLKPAFFQLTGDETPENVKTIIGEFGIPVLKSIHLPASDESSAVVDPAGFLKTIREYEEAGCTGFVLDVKSRGMYGGTGMTSNWILAREIINKSKAKIFMAGGLKPENISEAAGLGSYGLDLASGVEISPGVKSREKIVSLFTALKGTS